MIGENKMRLKKLKEELGLQKSNVITSNFEACKKVSFANFIGFGRFQLFLTHVEVKSAV